AEVEAFLTHLAADAKVAASTQNQALQALLFLYRQVLGMKLPWLDDVTRARRAKRLPVVLSPAEVRSVLSHPDGTSWLIASLLYGSGLRLMEAHRLRVKDLLLERGEIIVRDAKGGKDRVTVLPVSLVGPCAQRCSTLM
ncbi:MAG: phage integrase N-terminal SAM-like domain-containing protein, partial [Steroidobacteraceae bacterium]